MMSAWLLDRMALVIMLGPRRYLRGIFFWIEKSRKNTCTGNIFYMEICLIQYIKLYCYDTGTGN